MATRFNTGSRRNYGMSPVPSGYETKRTGTPDISIPSCGIEDVDTSMFNLFDKEIAPECGGTDSSPLKKVPVIFAAGEKWALLKKGRPLRDRNNTLVLPLITIVRTEISQDVSTDVAGRGINQQVGEIVIRRRLDKSDRDYQNLINKLLLQNQQNTAVNVDNATVLNQLTVDRSVGSLQNEIDVIDGALLKPSLLNNVYETIVVPTPQFYRVKYQVTVWSQYMQHTNQIIERIITSYLPQAQSWRLDTAKGYWFVATVEGGYETETNFDDMSQQERYIKNTFTVSVPAYFFATSAPGNPIPLKRYVSSPVIRFDIESGLGVGGIEIDEEVAEGEYVLGSDDPTLPLEIMKNSREDQRTPGWTRQKVYPGPSTHDMNDPALLSLPRGRGLTQITRRRAQGETIYKGVSIDDIEINIDNIPNK